MDRVFLDANVLFSAAYKADARVGRLWQLGDVVLCTSRYAIEEARSNLEEGEQLRRLDELTKSLRLFDNFESKLPRGVDLADKDVPILLAAIEAKADYLLTGDLRHFGPLIGKRTAGVIVMLPGKYLKRRQGDE